MGTLSGGAGNDSLTGGDCPDQLTGGNGADRFICLRPEDGGDTITDFVSGEDRIVVDLDGYGLWEPAVLVTDGAATTGDATLLFDSATGGLWINGDGNGAGDAELVAEFGAGTALLDGDLEFV